MAVGIDHSGHQDPSVSIHCHIGILRSGTRSDCFNVFPVDQDKSVLIFMKFLVHGQDGHILDPCFHFHSPNQKIGKSRFRKHLLPGPASLFIVVILIECSFPPYQTEAF